jgi:CDP-diacylglycerol--glycerol-3-phosphate 3-phosphatidyltransferase
MNLPNKLTLIRLLLSFLFLVVLYSNLDYKETIALGIFIIAGLTDHFDGRLARKNNLITNFGILMDPLADKILTSTAFISFVGLKLLPAWMAVIIVARELAITGLRLLAASKNIVLAAEKMGKHKTMSQIITIVSILVLISYPQWGQIGKMIFEYPVFGSPWIVWVVEIAKWTAVILTVISGTYYLWRNREIYLTDV